MLDEVEWFYGQNDRQHGPINLAQLQEMYRSGRLGVEDLVWREGMADWKAARMVPELRAGQAAAQPSAHSQPMTQTMGTMSQSMGGSMSQSMGGMSQSMGSPPPPPYGPQAGPPPNPLASQPYGQPGGYPQSSYPQPGYQQVGPAPQYQAPYHPGANPPAGPGAPPIASQNAGGIVAFVIGFFGAAAHRGAIVFGLIAAVMAVGIIRRINADARAAAARTGPGVTPAAGWAYGKAWAVAALVMAVIDIIATFERR